MTTQSQLLQVFNDNFVAYFRSHSAHINIVGRNFQSDHTLLGTIYEDLQDQIDHIGELLRTLGEFAPRSISAILEDSHVFDDEVEGDADELLTTVRDDLGHLKDCYEELVDVADSEGHTEIANYGQDRILAIAKFIWMLDSTLQ
jgi:starvation-inducible DNA-binding protein